MRILITGGNGFVGRPLVRSLLDHHLVTVLDNLRYGPARFTEAELRRMELLPVDIRDREALRRVIGEREPEVIVHLAAIHYIPECQADPGAAVETNVTGTVNLLQTAPAGARFVFASSAAVYQNSLEPLSEDRSPLGPGDIYGHTKLHGEHYLRYFAAANGLAAVAVRLFNVVGRGETSPHVLPEIVAQLKAGRRRLELGNLEARRDFIHVDDAAEGFRLAALATNLEPGEERTVNLGSGSAHSVRELIGIIQDVVGEEISVAADPERLRHSDNPLLLADISRIADVFGWKPARSLADAVVELWHDPDLPPGLMEKYLQ